MALQLLLFGSWGEEKKKKKEKDAEDHVQTHAVIWDVIIIN